MLILFPSEMFNRKKVDPSFQDEYELAQKAGHNVALVNQEELDAGNWERAIRFREVGVPAIYRGWMFHPVHYKEFQRALEDAGVDLINNGRQYWNCHWFPCFYPYIKEYSPESRWTTQWANGSLGIEELARRVEKFGDSPLIIKDFVKSRKHEWNEACYVPSALDEEAFLRVANTFVERQGEFLAGGVVARKFVPLKKIGTHEKSGMPLFNEYRTFVLNGKPVITGRYWTQGDVAERPNLDDFQEVINKVDSNFFTMDLAQTEEGDWIIIELGDGQVSGLQGIDPLLFYYALNGK